ncbi:CheR family methyltransferase [Reinekea marinisedimentorum]|uniref:protein-glutamate O-methyltransferase n=1 Tax=Reinekea marinisedimentorum TaxID=230495 RepID=A0A4R3I9X2_9GAMM|nr:CheR family methyltransferase [Reinekea marinisedimentorum]TCS43218.1 type IV pilus assembly protein PilK [Reinekea marinisedimentorum]
MALPVNQAPELSDAAFATWQDIIEERIGLQLPEQRRSFLKTCLSIRMREVGFDDYLAYYNHICDGDTGLIEWNRLMDRLTVQETRFFRDPVAFSLVKDHLQNRLKLSSAPLSLWSVGCSSGEEAYSLGITAQELLSSTPEANATRYGVTGTDISREALSLANAGSYSPRRLESIDSSLTGRYFTQQGHKYQIVQSVKDRTCFVRLNLLQLAGSPLKNLDVIYCQNVLIYFRKWRRKDIVTELADRLAPGGLLVLGLGDMVDWSHPELTRVPGEHVLAYFKRK